MDLFNVLSLIGGLCLFLFGMNVMGQALERCAGSGLRALLGKLTTNRLAGLLTGIGVTAVIQSSSATTVMVVGFVNSGLMSLKQAINVIMGANVGTTVTAWVLSLGGISSDNLLIQLLKPTSFSPILALIGIILYMFCKGDKKKDTGMIFLGFATLMFGMDAMSGAVAGLKDIPQFQQMFLLFKNPLLGMLAGMILTAIIQSSSASVGILQALAVTGQVSYGAAIPIIMGQNIGTCITTIISSFGANKNAKRAAMVHLSFNVIGTAVWLTAFCIIRAVFKPLFLDEAASLFGIALCHSIFNVLCTLLLLPMGNLLEKLVNRLVPDSKTPETNAELDERLLNTPPIALQRCRELANDMAVCAVDALKDSLHVFNHYDAKQVAKIREMEDRTDHYEDILGSYLVRLSTMSISASDNKEAAMMLKAIGDFERISDHAVNIVESTEEILSKDIQFTEDARQEFDVIADAINEILDLALNSFINNDPMAAHLVEPLEQVIDELKEEMRTKHIQRMQQGECSIVAGFVWSDLLTNLERTSDHCSNIAGGVMDAAMNTMSMHEALRTLKDNDGEYKAKYQEYASKYVIQ